MAAASRLSIVQPFVKLLADRADERAMLMADDALGYWGTVKV
jgi:hypothetical protein